MLLAQSESVSQRAVSAGLLSNMSSCETILPRNLEGGKHSSKLESQCVSYYRWLIAFMTSPMMVTDVSPSVDNKKMLSLILTVKGQDTITYLQYLK